MYWEWPYARTDRHSWGQVFQRTLHPSSECTHKNSVGALVATSSFAPLQLHEHIYVLMLNACRLSLQDQPMKAALLSQSLLFLLPVADSEQLSPHCNLQQAAFSSRPPRGRPGKLHLPQSCQHVLRTAGKKKILFLLPA